MAYFGFTDKLVRGETIKIFNYGNCKRDFTYIDDIVEGVVGVMQKSPDENENGAKYRIYNIGNNDPVNLLDFVQILSEELIAAGISADKAEPGFKHIIMAPVPDKRLGSLDAEYESAAGTVKSSWKYDGDDWTWKFTIPEGATATVILPGESEGREYEAGSYRVSI